ncbi:hypothetical protein RhiirB3_429494 [Rhizophagus irregularis]|nr:hypothetical protein RhiirB3_429494 [Rhizophagus irregularis]
MKEYTTLNDDFTQRLKTENRYTDERVVGDKRPNLESPGGEILDRSSPEDSSIWSEKCKEFNEGGSISPEEKEEEEQEIKPHRKFLFTSNEVNLVENRIQNLKIREWFEL